MIDRRTGEGAEKLKEALDRWQTDFAYGGLKVYSPDKGSVFVIKDIVE